jgi:hypothetical protein
MLGKTPLVAPFMPAFVCDVCGEIEYDDAMMMNIQYLIQQQTVSKRRRVRVNPQKPANKTRPLPGL